MAHAKFDKFKARREHETWTRKEMAKRTGILLAVHELNEKLTNESKYMKTKNVLWQLSQLKHKYPANNDKSLPENKNKTDAEIISLYVTELKPIISSAISVAKSCQSALYSTIGGNGKFSIKVRSFYFGSVWDLY